MLLVCTSNKSLNCNTSPYALHTRISKFPFVQTVTHGTTRALQCTSYSQVIGFQEDATKELCGCSQSPQAPTPALRLTASNPTLGHPHVQQGLAHGQRRASHDVATKLSPIDVSVSPHGVASRQSPSHAPTKNQGSAKAGGKGEAQGNGGKGGEATGRQLDSIVDEARAEVRS